MIYTELENCNKKASRLVYGTGNTPIMGEDVGAAKECIQTAYDCGFTIFDSAYAYGHAEKNFGHWLAQTGNRENVIIFDKGCNPGQDGSEDVMSDELIRRQNAESLDRLQTDYVDFYVLHRDEPEYPVEKVIDVLNELKDDKKIRKFGVSNWTLPRIIEANAYAKTHGLEGFSVLSPAYSMVDFVSDPWGRSVALSGEANREMREWYENQEMPVFPYSSLARGYLSGKFRTDVDKPIEECLWWAPIQEYDCEENRVILARAEKMAREKDVTVSQIALAWLLHQPMDIYPIVSPSSEKHMLDNIAALHLSLTKEEIDWLHRV